MSGPLFCVRYRMKKQTSIELVFSKHPKNPAVNIEGIFENPEPVPGLVLAICGYRSLQAAIIEPTDNITK
jgi:hypothetical protein